MENETKSNDTTKEILTPEIIEAKFELVEKQAGIS